MTDELTDYDKEQAYRLVRDVDEAYKRLDMAGLRRAILALDGYARSNLGIGLRQDIDPLTGNGRAPLGRGIGFRNLVVKKLEEHGRHNIYDSDLQQ